ncbi:MAG: ATP-binding cassette domain-containing protein [Roseburia sp.]|nr:ATP-binding cassette domain-containing protein [Roseburia sp.]MCM1557005.1 ATP-binding cassette domain-containing protein [Anaeroplasma bactoclasticum]
MLRLENVCKTYEDKSGAKTVLNNISFELPEKGMVFILGKSGSGKTTILNLIGGLDRVTKGSIYIKDKELSFMTGKERNQYRAHFVGFIFQEFFLFENRTVKQNLLMMGELLHKKYNDEEIREILKEVDLEGYENKKCNLLSSGEKQRISIARTLIKDSKIILADEPTGSLDSENGERVFNILKRISKTRLVVVVSHDVESAKKYADSMVRIKDGEVIEKIGFSKESCENKETYQVEKTHGISLSNVMKAAIQNIKYTWVRMTLNFIICFIGLLLFFVSNVVATVDAPKRLVNGLYDNQISIGRLYRKSDSDSHAQDQYMTMEEATQVCSDNPKLEFLKITTKDAGMISVECDGLTEVSQKTIQQQHLLYGKMPSDMNSFFITKSHAVLLLEQLKGMWSWWDPTTCWWWEPPLKLTDSIESIIGYEVKVTTDKVYTLSGIVEDSDLPYNYVYFNEGFLELEATKEWYCDYFYFKMSKDFNADYKFFKQYHGDLFYHRTNSKYYIKTSISEHFYTTMATYITMTDWLYGISLCQMLFVILISFNIISVSIRKNQKGNGIRRALGYSNFDLFKIYLMQNAIPFILLIPLVSVSGYFIVNVINNNFLRKLSVSFGMFGITTINIVWLILLCIGVLVIGTILPMIKIFKKQPIDIIKAN